jgi:hypothetical protein
MRCLRKLSNVKLLAARKMLDGGVGVHEKLRTCNVYQKKNIERVSIMAL